MPDLVAGRALPEERIGDQVVYGVFLLESVAGQSDVDPPVLQWSTTPEGGGSSAGRRRKYCVVSSEY